jgi:hypothetical protein
MKVDVIGLDYDYWYELAKADDRLEQGEQPEALSSEGLLYYARFRHAGEQSEPTSVDSIGRSTIDVAMRDAEEAAPGAITWESS